MVTEEQARRRKALVERLLTGVAMRLAGAMGPGAEVTVDYIPPRELPDEPPSRTVVEYRDDLQADIEERAREAQREQLRGYRVRLIALARTVDEIEEELDGTDDPEVVARRQGALDEALAELAAELGIEPEEEEPA